MSEILDGVPRVPETRGDVGKSPTETVRNPQTAASESEFPRSSTIFRANRFKEDVRGDGAFYTDGVTF